MCGRIRQQRATDGRLQPFVCFDCYRLGSVYVLCRALWWTCTVQWAQWLSVYVRAVSCCLRWLRQPAGAALLLAGTVHRVELDLATGGEASGMRRQRHPPTVLNANVAAAYVGH